MPHGNQLLLHQSLYGASATISSSTMFILVKLPTQASSSLAMAGRLKQFLYKHFCFLGFFHLLPLIRFSLLFFFCAGWAATFLSTNTFMVTAAQLRLQTTAVATYCTIVTFASFVTCSFTLIKSRKPIKSIFTNFPIRINLKHDGNLFVKHTTI